MPIYLACCVVFSIIYYCVIFMYIQYKESALHLAAREGHLDMVKFLVSQFGERVHETSFFRETCCDITKVRGHRHVVEYHDVPTLKSKVRTAV